MNESMYGEFMDAASEVNDAYVRAQAIFVRVPHMINPSHFYIQPTVYSKYLRLIEGMQPTAPFTPQKSDLILLNSGNVIKRGQVIAATNSNCFKVFTLDYGEILEDVSVQHIMEIPRLLRQMPAMSTLCSLLVEPYHTMWSQEAIDTMRKLVTTEKIRIIMKSWQNYFALITCMYPDVSFILLNCRLASNRVADEDIAVHYCNLPKPVVRYYSHENFIIGQKLKVKFMYKDPHLGFYVRQVDSTPFIDYYPNPNYQMVNRKLFIGYGLMYRENNKLKRAIVVKTFGRQSAEVRLIDTGEIIKTSVNKLFDGPLSIFNKPILSIYCITYEEDFKMKYIHFKKYFVHGVEFNVTITKLGDKFAFPHQVNISDVDDVRVVRRVR